VSILTEYGALLLQARDVDAALEPLMKAASVEPESQIVRCNLATVLRKKGQFREAEREYRESLRADPDYFPALLGLGTLLLEKESFSDAAEVLRKAVARDPRSVEANWSLARAQRLSGSLKEAAETLQRARELGSAEIANEAGVVACARGRYAEAVELFDEALTKEPASTLYKSNREKAAAAAKFLSDSGTTPMVAEK
jgi:Tfp pilus assembly protein PilF